MEQNLRSNPSQQPQDIEITNATLRWMTKCIYYHKEMHDFLFDIIKKNNETYKQNSNDIVLDIEKLKKETCQELYQGIKYWIDTQEMIKKKDEEQQQYETILQESHKNEKNKEKPKEEWIINVEDENLANNVQSFLNDLPKRNV